MFAVRSWRTGAGGLGLVLAFSLLGCVSARMSDHRSNELYRNGSYRLAAESLKRSLQEEGEGSRDELLFLLDIGLALHAARDYKESNRYFLMADRVAEIKDYTSLTTEGATFFTSENLQHYKGENFEKVLINTYLAMNFALQGEFESALVEARKVNRKLYRMIHEGEKKYKQNAFAYYLSAMVYEADGAYNDAYIDYKKARELEPDFPLIGRDLWRTAYLSGLDTHTWEKSYGLDAKEERALARETRHRGGTKGELVVLYENGISPIKRSNPQWRVLPKFYPRLNPVTGAEVRVDGKRLGETLILDNIEVTAIQNLDDKYAGLIAKKIAGVVAKEVVAHQVEKQTNSPLLGFLTKAFFYMSDQPDLRSWNLLPRDLQVARFALPPGDHSVELRALGGPLIGSRDIVIRPGRKTFVNFRYMP